jgi:hypothetical protein
MPYDILPIEVHHLIDDKLDCLVVHGKMRWKFGPWLEGSEHTLTFDFIEGMVTEHCDEGIVVACCKMRLETQ